MESVSQITLNDVNEKFLKAYPKKSQVINVISRFILTEFGLIIKGNKISAEEKSKAKQIAQRIYLKDLTSELISIYLLESFRKQNIIPEFQKDYKSSVNLYLKFLENKFAFDLNSSGLYRIRSNPSRIIDKSHLKKNKKTRQKKEVIAIKLSPKFYLKDYKIIYPDLDRGQIVSIIQCQLDRIKEELQGFEDFCRLYLENEEETVDFYSGYIQRLLGWLYLQERDLDKVSITNLIPVIDHNFKIGDFDDDFDRYALAKEKCKWDSKKAAKEVRNFLSLFFKMYGVVTFNSQEKNIVSLITLAKYLYKDITDKEDVENYEDIVIIQSLRNFRRKLKKNSLCNSNIKNLKFTWDELLIIREQLKFEASLNYSYSQLKNGRTHRDSRRKSAIATCKMRFLIFCLLTIIPPDRARTIRELRIGETLKYGLKTKEGFVSKEKLSNSAQAKYYIHLLEKDYKTGKTYGEFWGELPNCQFKDDTRFYDYLNDWIYCGWREVLLRNENHNYCFCQSRTAKQHNKGSFSGLVANIFENKTGIKMGTHEFRDIFCTYLEEVNASPEVRTSAAYWMKHSEEIARKIYTVVDLQAKLAPAFEFMNRLNF